jgi:hypothetical protein
MSARVSWRVLRHERVGIGRLTPGRGMVMEASEESRDASAGRWQAGALPASRGLGCLMTGCGRTGAVGVPPRVAPRPSRHRQAAQLVSTKALGAVHRRMTTRIEVPQVGQRAARGGGG